MQFTKLTPKQSLNKAYLKEKVSRTDIELLKRNLNVLFENIARTGDEEHLKSQITYFLRDTWYHGLHQINPVEKNDLVIHTGKSANDPVGVIIEVKSLTNKGEMLSLERPNTKAFHELVLYYLRERIDKNNNEVKYLIATNTDQWFIIDANEFDKKIYRNSVIRKLYELKVKDHKDNPFFYDELKKYLETAELNLEATWFSIEDFRRVAQNTDPKDDQKLIALFKILSPVHLLKLPFANDSNSLQPKFYSELLHLIGLTEVKEGSKKLIQRKKEGERNAGSLLESTIIQLDTHDKISRISKPSQYGEKHEERLYNVALELVITWVNRILFLKLLEAQLLSYHKQDKEYTFLNKEKIKDFDDLDKLFFSVLAKKPEERREDINQLFGKVPYLNSSLFEPTELEHVTLFINGLEDRVQLPLMAATVLKDGNGKPLKGSLETLDYLFSFLNAYDFSSEGSEDIQEDNKTLINASVLGLIFEKINGYKDGSFFTPGFITMYMCRETLRRAVVQKFNETKGWECKEFSELYDKIEDRTEANQIINSLKICDPAVGSGHFLVSALNEILAIKHDLKVLQDREGHRLKEYHVEVVNDELVVTDEEGNPFLYNPRNRESQRVQETLFHEKQTIIENCLFGVDINPNSVKICRLRLWIELLKNAYYKGQQSPLSVGEGPGVRLETLPNIDINIKVGNSLISRFALDADLKQALKKSRYSIDAYKIAVQTYRNAQNKEQKREMEQLISTIKNDFRTEISTNDPKVKKLDKLSSELYAKYQANQLFDAKLTAAQKKDRDKLATEINKLSAEIKEIKENRIYENAFEWRFEFPEVLDDEGVFVGFDAVIGNPPYGVKFSENYIRAFQGSYQTFNWRGESYALFIEKAVRILSKNGEFAFIIPDTLLNLGFTEVVRRYILQNTVVKEVVSLPSNVFSDAKVDTILLFFKKELPVESFHENIVMVNFFENQNGLIRKSNNKLLMNTSTWHALKTININSNQPDNEIINKVDNTFSTLGQIADIFYGIKAYQKGKGKPAQTEEIKVMKPYTSSEQMNQAWLPFFDGKHIGRYSLLWKGDNWINYGPWLAEPRVPEKFIDEKILIRKIVGKTLIAHYIPYTSYCNTLLFVVKLRTDSAIISYKALLGILNSTFIGWYFKKKFQISHEDTFPQIMIRDILQFSIPNYNNAITKMIEDKVTCFIEEGSGSSIISGEIDQLVYQLYGLTEDEIRMIEGTDANDVSKKPEHTEPIESI